MPKPEVLIIGGGMITQDQILPSLYQLQRLGRIGPIAVCALSHETVRALGASETCSGLSGTIVPGVAGSRRPAAAGTVPQALAALPPRQIVVVAVPTSCTTRS